ncbi:hypothetical protein B0T21DRAFT_283077 [Apiosordaria backusii]|uniref:Uncharacterized protein n=1 Tax=Apiosordaria backusii TaxID=314023 RepID=A0AA40EM31_9PEZI|nr:hypothetical protein B0T21DRAFT_283077 [Apiosordaria backusii]
MQFLAFLFFMASAMMSVLASSIPASSTTFLTKVTPAPFLSGCDDPKLWQQSLACPDLNVHGACRNPHRDRDEGQITYAHEWFKACQGEAYTFPKDDEANSNGECQSGIVNCQILPKKK